MTESGLIALGVSCGAFALCVVLTPAAMALSRQFGLVDKPGPRKVHSRAVPRIGGIAIGVAALVPFTIALAGFDAVQNAAEAHQLYTLLICSALVLAVGLLDDVLEISARWKVLVLTAAAIALCSSGASIDATVSRSGFLPNVGLLTWLLTIVWLVALPVAMNFIDGLDGLAAGIGLATAGVMAIGLAIGGDPAVALLLLSLTAALLAFLIFNRHPASVFMGDSGSMFIGFLIAGSAVVSGPRSGLKISYVLPIVTLSVPLLDTTLTFIRRGVLQRRSIFSAERGHIHHRLLDMGLSHKHAVWCLYGVTAAAAAVGVTSIFNTGAGVLGGLVLVAPLLIAVFRMSGSVRGRDTLSAVRRNLHMRRANKKAHAAFEDAQLRFRDIRTFDQWWERVCESADNLDLITIDLPVLNRDGSERKLAWSSDALPGPTDEVFKAQIPIRQRRDKQVMLAETSVAVVEGSLELASQRIALFSRLLNEFNPTMLDPQLKQLPKLPAETLAPTEDLLSAANTPAGQPRVAIVHDFLYVYAGAEKVLEQMLEVFPHADLFSLFDFLPAGQRGFIRNKPVRTSFLQRMPGVRKRHRAYLPLMPLAIEQFDLTGYDIVLSSSYCVAKGVLTGPDQLHLCYCHSPVRFAWDMQHQYLSELQLDGSSGRRRAAKGFLARSLLHYLRMWDVRSATGVDKFLSNSDFVAGRIAKSYRREAEVLYPPVDTDAFVPGNLPREDFYVTASRMVPYKRIDLIVDAFTKMPHRRLIVVGDGPEFDKIAAKAGPNVRLVGRATHDELLQYLQMARAFVFAAEEDFGIAPVEAMACGTPVVAYRAGGVCETVIEGETGTFFNKQTADAIVAAIVDFEAAPAWDEQLIRDHAISYSAANFRDRLSTIASEAWAQSRTQRRPARAPRSRDLSRVIESLSTEIVGATPPDDR